MGDLYLIFKNLFRRKLRAALLVVSILVAFVIYGVLGALNAGFNAPADLAAENRLVVANRVNFTFPLPVAYVNRIQSIPGVRTVTHITWMGAYYQDPAKGFFVGFAVDPESFLEVNDEYLLSDAEKQAFFADRGGAIVGEALAAEFGWKVGDRVPISSNYLTRADGGRVWDMTIQGVFRGRDAQTDTNQLFFHYNYLNESRSFGRNFVGNLNLTTEDPTQNARIIAAIDDQFANSPFETETVTESQFQQAFAAQFVNIAFIVVTVSSAAFATILLIVGNTMALAVRERTKEIAVLKTLGFPATRIFGMVLGESVLLSLLGGSIGLGLAALVAAFPPPQIASIVPGFALTPGVVVSAVAIMLGLGIVTGLVPAVNALRLNIVTALGRV